jgi:hypothetical protein
MSKKESKISDDSLRIGFDFDKVFVNYPPLVPDILINWLSKKKSKTLKYRMPGPVEQQIRILSHSPLFRHPIEKNISTLKKIYLKNNSLYLISGRFGFLQKRTDQWMNKHNLEKYFKEIHFNFKNKQNHIFKDEMIKALKISHYFDDDLDLLLYLAKHNPKVKFYWLDTSRISKRYIPFENIQRISSLSDFKEL